MGGLGSKQGGNEHPSSTVHLRDKKDLAGVGIIFRKGPDGSLIVKDLIDGSGAEECKQIQAGDTLTQVDDVKISKVSIAEVSGMILGEPGQPVRLKFTRQTGRSKRKYKVVLKRTVRATLEPTYRVQKDGVNTRVTHIHLDCLQHVDNPVAQPPTQVRDVLDASGNVVGPGLLEHARTLAASRDSLLSPPQFPGVERIDSSHPAWPGNKSRTQSELSGQGGVLPNTKSGAEEASRESAQNAAPANAAATVPPRRKPKKAQPSAAAEAAAGETAADQSTMPVKDTTETLPVNNPLDAVSADLDASSLLKMYDLLPSEQPPSSTQTAGVFPVPAGLVADTAHRAAALDSGPPPPLQDAVGSLDQWTPPEPPVESMLLQPAPPPIATSVLDQGSKSEVKFTAVAVPAGELEEEERDGGGHDWEGLAESRIAVFEAKQKALRPDRRSSAKQVDLEKEWARTARAAQGPAQDPPAAGHGSADKPAVPGEHVSAAQGAAAAESQGPAKEGLNSADGIGGGSLARKDSGAGRIVAGVGKGPAGKDKGDTAGDSRKGKGDLAALMAARKKKMEEEDDEGFYF